MSDILIPNTEMPRKCCECDYHCGLNIIARFDDTKRHPDCPLVEVPAHGRLGDLDFLESYLTYKHKECGCPFDIDAFLVLLRKVPTIIAASGNNCTAPNCLDCEGNDECNSIGIERLWEDNNE